MNMSDIDFSHAHEFDSFVMAMSKDDGWVVMGRRPNGDREKVAAVNTWKQADSVKVFFEAYRDAQRGGR